MSAAEGDGNDISVQVNVVELSMHHQHEEDSASEDYE